MSSSPSTTAAAGSPPADPLVGVRLGKYRICGILGRGGMGLVYEAEDQTLQRRVAVKLLSSRLANDPEMLGMFLREARAAARLSHPNTVAIHEIDKRDGVVYIVMELVRGGSAADYVRAHGCFPWMEATRIAADVCRALSAAHAAGLIHRDVKPANVMRSHDGVVKLADFGLAKILEREDSGLRLRPTGSGASTGASSPSAASASGSSSVGSAANNQPKPGEFSETMSCTLTGMSAQTQQASRYASGTPQYMSPEQCQCEPLDGRSDVCSLGATYYALLTGASPFAGVGSLDEIMMAQVCTPLPDIRKDRPDIPAGVAAVLSRAMAKSPAERYQTAAEMLADLEGVLRNPAAVGGAGVAWGGPTVSASGAIPVPLAMPPANEVITRTASVDTMPAVELKRKLTEAIEKPTPAQMVGLAAGVLVLLLGLWWASELFRDPYSGYSHNPSDIPPDAKYKSDGAEPPSPSTKDRPSLPLPSRASDPLVDDATLFVWRSPTAENRLADGRECKVTSRGLVASDGAMRCKDGAFLADDSLAVVVTEACRARNAVTLEMVIRPAVMRQSGPARIVSLSTDGNSRNFSVAQEQDAIVLRLRTTETGLNGMPGGQDFVITRLPPRPRELHIVISYSPNNLNCWVNGELQRLSSPFRGDLSNWDGRHHLIFGNEFSEPRPWQGSIRHVQILARPMTEAEVRRRYTAASPITH